MNVHTLQLCWQSVLSSHEQRSLFSHHGHKCFYPIKRETILVLSKWCGRIFGLHVVRRITSIWKVPPNFHVYILCVQTVHKPHHDYWSLRARVVYDHKSPCPLWFICYILHSDWSLLLLVNTHGSFHCEQGVCWYLIWLVLVVISKHTW